MAFDPVKLVMGSTEETLSGIAEALFGGSRSSSGGTVEEIEDDEDPISRSSENDHDLYDDDDDDYTAYSASDSVPETESTASPSAPVLTTSQPLFAQMANGTRKNTDYSVDRTRHKSDDRSQHR